jgi:hypothetical protein
VHRDLLQPVGDATTVESVLKLAVTVVVHNPTLRCDRKGRKALPGRRRWLWGSRCACALLTEPPRNSRLSPFLDSSSRSAPTGTGIERSLN